MKSKKPFIQPVSLPASYGKLLKDLKDRIRTAQVKAALSVNRELLKLYWEIGEAIVGKQQKEGWGSKVIDRLADDLQQAFPGLTGFSRANVYRMRSFYIAYKIQIVAQAVRQSRAQFVPQAVGQLSPPKPILEIPWGHNVLLLEKLKDPRHRIWYARKTVEHGWSRAMLLHHIESKLHAREGKAITNFRQTLPPPQSDLAQQTMKDPYIFDFLTISAHAQERDLEQGLLDHIGRFLLELGVGFAFVGRQYHLEIDGQDYYLDLLFYHLRLRCFVVIDLKMEPFKPEFAGKMNFYLSAVDDQMRQREDNPTIGLLLCKERHKLTVEYALRDMRKPIGVAEWQTKLVESLPKELKGKLPTIEQIEQELSSTKKKKKV